MSDDELAKLRALAYYWRTRALEMVPTEYADRRLHDRYFRLDNEAAGLITCAEELVDLLDNLNGGLGDRPGGF